MRLSGSCLCGEIGFELEGWVSPIQACHARRCRKATGALFAPEIAASAEAFRWIGDEGRIASYEAPVLDQPPAYRRNFCNRCGSPLPVVVEGAGMVILHAGILDDARGLTVFRHAFTGQKSEGYVIPDGAPQFEGQPPVPDLSDLLE
ncbi:GFA family protein [Pseudoruegeria sp. HB172150]|uniref:GFA family protein n=1 Tax=Pseudoruegeria sp. HB172150 TaxID=2721164 RepID=UPI0015542C47|nr:GFA family protein [Pseudoruegeria sp. HB172150]